MLSIHTYSGFLIVIALRYFLVAGIAWLTWYVLLRDQLLYKKIQQRFPKGEDYRRELGYSFLTIFVFTCITSLLLLTPIKHYTQFYAVAKQHSAFYFLIAFPLMFLIHDTYFYFTHRLMHHRKLFRYFHLVHHQSTNPSPWAAFAFHPLEAFVEAGIFAVLLFSIPLTPMHLFVFFAFMMLYNVYGHLGWELYPKGFSQHWLGKWVNTSVNHNQHHQFFTGNYGLYFLFWDRMLNTIRPDYEKRFEEITSLQKKKIQPVSSNLMAKTKERDCAER